MINGAGGKILFFSRVFLYIFSLHSGFETFTAQEVTNMDNSASEHYPLPVFVNVAGRRCLVVGGGTIAERKIRDLLESGANVTVVAEKPSPDVERLHEEGAITLEKHRFKPVDVEGAMIVFAATDDPQVNSLVSEESIKRGILVNAVDNPSLCTFYSGAVIKRGPLRVAVSTSGLSPKIAAELRRELEQTIPESYGEYVRSVGEWRRWIIDMDDIPEQKKRLAIERLTEKATFAAFRELGKEKTWEKLRKTIFSS